jgi:hypothetical protein
MKLATRQAKGFTREQIMEKQLLGNGEEAAVAEARTASPSQELVKRVKNAISTNIGLYEIRVNLFLWGLFRATSQKDN